MGETLENIGTIMAIIISVGTCVGFVVRNAKERGAREKIMEQVNKRLEDAEKKIEEQYSDRNDIKLTLKDLSSTFNANMEWIKETFKEIKSFLAELRKA